MRRFEVEDRNKWRQWVTPKALAGKPIHRWCIFPHSFTSELVHALIEEWGLSKTDRILDPFAGAGTTPLAAKEKGIPATGYDISPLAVLASRVKIGTYDLPRLRHLWLQLKGSIEPACWNGAKRDYPELVRAALPGQLLGTFDALSWAVAGLEATKAERNFFKLALLATIPEYSRAIATGGWLRWTDRRRSASTLCAAFSGHIRLMLDDLDTARLPRRRSWRAQEIDARSLPDNDSTYSAVITSPPYPNRHDYTRVFGVELMFGFLNWEQTRKLRYQSIHSHPEAHPERPDAGGYTQPKTLAWAVAKLREQDESPRLIRMLEGYFLDLYLALREVRRVCKPGARIAFVVGNAQYGGHPISVDELTGEVGEQAGLECEKLLVARYRGNSAQQMGKHGRNPSRESVVVFRTP